jgi:glutathione S-transferase
MKLFTSVGPNPRVVRMFLAEKGVEVPTEEVDIRSGVNRQPEFLAKNPSGQSPALELDSGAVIAEITAICEYIEDKHPEPALVGTTAEEKANTRMWTRRVDLNICEPLAGGFRFGEGLKMFQDRIRCIPEASDGLKAAAQDKLTWLNGEMEGREFVGGESISMADVLLFCFLDFGQMVGQKLNEDNKNITAWYERMKARPSAAA